MFIIFQKKKAQNLIEYTILIGIVSLVFVAMSVGMKRSVQGIVKVTADQIGQQNRSDQFADPLNFDPYQGYLVESTSSTSSDIQKQRAERLGNIIFSYNETVVTTSNAMHNLGYTNRME